MPKLLELIERTSLFQMRTVKLRIDRGFIADKYGFQKLCQKFCPWDPLE